ncbi:Probable RNA-directed DNA polymerase from transposon BS [Eumeta japonica]|uniref:Probable RNA-directed DNA polymerase from transposon BS n=1 Tax=Eumeta variegata TaxID=151549 RepID=A0A4C1XHV3_EUMVA|nr:Probable RNA-directed DNA polymerase from transposon BS [Eumeta japonica]
MTNKQFGFTRGRSTIDAGVELVQHIFGAWEDSRDAIGVFCDLSKAFDCVRHETLIGKLRHYGVTDRALDLLKSYLSNRVQRVDVNVRNKELEFVNSRVFLGITLDDRLQWGPHISKLAKRLSSAAYAVKKMRNLSDVETARLVYFGCFHSLMSYGILLWGNAADTQKIFVLQKEAGRSRNLQVRTSYVP